MRILYISSRPLSWSANLALDFINLLKGVGHDVDFLTTYKFEGMDSSMYSVYDEMHDYRYFSKVDSKPVHPLKQILQNPIMGARKVLRKMCGCEGVLILKDEKKTIVPVADLTKSLPHKTYDLVITLFWQDLLSTVSLKAIYEKLNCPIFIYSVDMFPMTGGCANIYDCDKYKIECKKCRLSKFMPESAHENYLQKKNVYAAIDCYIFGNSWMRERFKESNLFRNDQIGNTQALISSEKFKPLDISKVRAELGLPLNKFIFFCGAADMKSTRKGFAYLQYAINNFTRRHEGASDCLLVVAGKENPELNELIEMESLNVGFLPVEKLAKMYAASDVYLSPTIVDAGPTMVNQSLMCGTPVVAFSTGVAQEAVIKDVTGYLAKYKDVEDFENGIEYIYSYENLEELRSSCRDFALKHYSESAKIALFESEYKRLIIDKNDVL